MNLFHLESRPSALRKHLPKALLKLAVRKELGNARLLVTVCIATPIAEQLNKCLTLIANVAKSTNDLLYFINRFHSDVH